MPQQPSLTPAVRFILQCRDTLLLTLIFVLKSLKEVTCVVGIQATFAVQTYKQLRFNFQVIGRLRKRTFHSTLQQGKTVNNVPSLIKVSVQLSMFFKIIFNAAGKVS